MRESPQTCNASQNEDYKLEESNEPTLKSKEFNLDVDSDGRVTALIDGLMVIRELFAAAFAGESLFNKAISPTATRSCDEVPHLNPISD